MEERRFRWSKIIVDWFAASGGYKPSFAREEITSAVTAIHGIGAHVAVRTQSAEAGQFAVEAGLIQSNKACICPVRYCRISHLTAAFSCPRGTSSCSRRR